MAKLSRYGGCLHGLSVKNAAACIVMALSSCDHVKPSFHDNSETWALPAVWICCLPPSKHKIDVAHVNAVSQCWNKANVLSSM